MVNKIEMFWKTELVKLTADQEVAQLRVRLEVQARAREGESSHGDEKCPSCPEIKRDENSMLPTDLFLRAHEEHVRVIIKFSMSRGKNRPLQGSCEF